MCRHEKPFIVNLSLASLSLDWAKDSIGTLSLCIFVWLVSHFYHTLNVCSLIFDVNGSTNVIWRFSLAAIKFSKRPSFGHHSNRPNGESNRWPAAFYIWVISFVCWFSRYFSNLILFRFDCIAKSDQVSTHTQRTKKKKLRKKLNINTDRLKDWFFSLSLSLGHRVGLNG